MMSASETTGGRRIELILRQIDALPTLPTVATRLLALTANDQTHARRVIELVNSDPALTSKVLALCRRADTGLRADVMTIERAVLMLGFSAIRSAALSVKVVEAFTQLSAAGEAADLHRFDRVGFWRHSLAVAILSELIAAAHPGVKDLNPDEAFVCGLLHDVGKLALDHVLPKSFARVIELTDLNQGNIAEFERRVVGLDHHTVGKRLAEQWQLPHRLQDCIWLHGSAYDTLPRLEHRRMIGLVGLADLLARRHHIGYSGNHQFKQSAAELAVALELDPHRCDKVMPQVFEELEKRSLAMGLDEKPSRELFLQSIQQANQVLGRLNSALERRGRAASRQTQVIDAIAAFHAAATPGRSVQDVMNQVAASVRSTLGGGFYALLMQQESPAGDDRAWLVCQYGEHSRPLRCELAEPPPHSPDLWALDPREPAMLSLASILPWVTDYLVDAPDLRQVRVLPLSCGWGTAAVLLHNRDDLPPWPQLSSLTSTWGAAIAAAAQHDGARRLGEDLAEANSALAEAQDRLLRSESMARLGEMAAGAAHEMNNPLAVISGRSQLLALTLPPGSKEHHAAQTIVEQAHHLSDLITSLRLFADPPKPTRRPCDVAALLREAIEQVKLDVPPADEVKLNLLIGDDLPALSIDAQQIAQAIHELLVNAVQAEPKSTVTINCRVDAAQHQLVIQVSDDGVGMDDHTLSHAMDPFFSAKRAGRRVGMGLARARQLVAGHGGGIDLRSVMGRGTAATVVIPLDCIQAAADRESWNRSSEVGMKPVEPPAVHGPENFGKPGESLVAIKSA